MTVTIARGNPAMGEATACIIPTNPNMYIRGDIGGAFSAVGGPMVQNDAMRHAPAQMGRVIAINSGGTAYHRLYAAVAFPFEQTDTDWRMVGLTLGAAIAQAAKEGHAAVSVPFFHDIPNGAADLTEPHAITAMKSAAENAPIDVHIFALNDRQLALLNEAFGPKESSVEDTPKEPAKPGRPRNVSSAKSAPAKEGDVK